jgi:sugar phosphate isomerase/epimerase
MPTDPPIRAALSLDALGPDARAAFDLAAAAGYRGVSFATNHAQLSPDALGASARRHLKTLLASKRLSLDALRAAAPRAGLTDPAAIDRTLDNARKAMLLARELGVETVALHVGPVGQSAVPEATLVSALRELAQQADAAGLTLALGAEGTESLAGLLKQVDYERARVNLDTARAIAAGEDPLEVAELLASGAGHGVGQVTAADAVRAGKTVRAAFLGEGQLPLTDFLEILEEGGRGGHVPLVVDVRDLPDPAAGAAHAAAVLRKALRR